MTDVIQEQDLTGATNLKGNPRDNLFIMENGMGQDMSYSYFDEEHSELGGGIRKALARMRVRRRARQSQKANAQNQRLKNKNLAAQAQLASANNLGNLSNQSDPNATAMAAALASGNGGNIAPSTGMSTGAKVGIALSIAAVIGGIIYFVVKKKKAGAAK